MEKIKKPILLLLAVITFLAGSYFVYNSFGFTQDIKTSETNKNYIAFSDKNASEDIIFKATPTSSSGENYYVSANLNVSNIITRYKGKTITINFYDGTSEKAINNKITSKNIVDSGSVQLLSNKNDNSTRYYRIEFLIDGKKIDIRENNLALTLSVDMSKSVVINYSYTSSVQTFSAPYDGIYRIELWGAQGNYYDEVYMADYKKNAGKGAYTAGTIKLAKGETLYIYVGQNATTEGTYNAAAFNAGSYTAKVENEHRMSSGGGATDVRLVGGAWNSAASLASRIMVAGGGGGTLVHHVASFDQYGHGGSGGGLIGYRAIATNINKSTGTELIFASGPYGGSQTSGGTGGGIARASLSDGKFGIGGDGGNQNPISDPDAARAFMRNYLGAAYYTTCGWPPTLCGDSYYTNELFKNANFGGGGGGGYYGGGGGGLAEDCHHGGAGGSSYISGHVGSIATINNGNLTLCATSGTTPEDYVGPTYRGCSVYQNNTKYAFSDTVMIDGEGYGWTYRRQALTQMPNPNGGYYALGNGHEGSGKAKITSTTGQDVAHATYTKGIYDIPMPTLNITAKTDRTNDVIKSEVTIENKNQVATCQTQLVIPIDVDAITNIRNIKITSSVKYTPTSAVVKDNKITITLSEPFKKGDKVTVTYDADQKSETNKTKIDLDPYVIYYPARDGICYNELIDEPYKQTKTAHDDTPVVGTIKIIKTDSETNKKLSNTVFGLYDKNGKRVKDCYGSEIKSLTTDANGSITINNLLYGTYYLKEEKPTPGYYILPNSISVNLNKTNSTVEVKNTAIKLTIIKEDKFTHTKLASAKFTIYDVNNKKTFKEFESTTNGNVIELPQGEYTLKETLAPNGYQNNNDEYKIIVTDTIMTISLKDKKIWEGQNYSLTITNEPTRISISKKDIDTNEFLSNITLGIYDKDGNIIKDTVTKEELKFKTDGTKKWFYVAPGEYQIKELIMLDNYETIDTGLTFKVTANGSLEYTSTKNEFLILEDKNITLYNAMVQMPTLDIKAKIDRVKDVIKSEVTIENKNEFASCQTQLVIPIDADAITNIRNIKITSSVKYTPTPAVVKDNKITITLSEPFKKGDKVTITYDADQKSGTNKTKIDLDPYVIYYPSRTGACYNRLIIDKYKQIKTDHDDTPVVGIITIIKIDSETNKKLQNSVFGLYDKNGKRVKDCYGNEIKSLITDKNGTITIKNLLYNTYYLKEEKSSDGFYLLSEAIEIDLKKTDYDITIKNNPIKITIVKEDYFTHKKLEGAKFTIYDVNNKNIYREIMSTKDKLEIKMVPGEYIIKEKFAPAGYQLSEEEYRVVVTSQGIIVTQGDTKLWEGGNYKLTIYNEPTQIVIDKKDIKTGNNLSGATLTIYDKDGNIAKDTVTKEEMSFTTDGEAKWYYIAPGEYTIKETESPEGYDKIENDLNFEVTANGNLVYNGKDSEYIYLDENYLVIYNGEAEIPVPNTGLYVGIGTIILGGAFAYTGYKIINKKTKED